MNIIIEGLDNTGKSTLIDNLVKHFNHLTIHKIHYGSTGLPPEETKTHAKKLFREFFILLNMANSFGDSCFIADRSHLGEMVYGPKYRNYSGDYVLDIEQEFVNNAFWKDLFLITLVDEPQNLIDRDDGLSISVKTEDIEYEKAAFERAHNLSNIENKLFININNKTIEEVFDEVVKFIKTKGKN